MRPVIQPRAYKKVPCNHCGDDFAHRHLKPAPEGGAVCIDWFNCAGRAARKAAVAKLDFSKKLAAS